MKKLILACAALAMTGCATVATFTIENRLMELGLSQKNASCMADGLEDRLNDSQLTDFAQFTVGLSKPKSTLALFNTLKSINDPDIARAVGITGVACIIGAL